MTKKQFEGSRVVVIDPNREVRHAICEGLRARGFSHVDGTGALAELEDLLGNHLVDLVIGDAEFDEEGFSKITKTVRQGEHGPNPYLIAMASVGNPTEENFKQVVAAGTDNVLVKPLSVKMLIDRITTIVHKRKSFVVSTDYIGPDRRLRPRQQVCLPLLDVPNTLKERFDGTFDKDRILEEIAKANEQVNLQRTTQNAVLINEIVRQVVPHFESGDVDDGVLLHLTHLRRAAKDSAKRVTEHKDKHVARLCKSLVPVTQKLINDYQSPDSKDLKLLKDLATSIYMANKTDHRIEELTQEITDSIESAKRFADLEIETDEK